MPTTPENCLCIKDIKGRITDLTRILKDTHRIYLSRIEDELLKDPLGEYYLKDEVTRLAWQIYGLEKDLLKLQKITYNM